MISTRRIGSMSAQRSTSERIRGAREPPCLERFLRTGSSVSCPRRVDAGNDRWMCVHAVNGRLVRERSARGRLRVAMRYDFYDDRVPPVQLGPRGRPLRRDVEESRPSESANRRSVRVRVRQRDTRIVSKVSPYVERHPNHVGDDDAICDTLHMIHALPNRAHLEDPAGSGSVRSAMGQRDLIAAPAAQTFGSTRGKGAAYAAH